MITITKIKKALAECAVAEWRIVNVETESVETFFVKKELDTRRVKKVNKFTLAVFREEEKNGNAMKGFVEIPLTPELEYTDLLERIKGAYATAQYALNKTYSQPKAVKGKKADTSLEGKTLAECEGEMVKALFQEDKGGKAFLNSAELFVEKKQKTVLSSEGTKVTFTTGRVKGEFVVQCKEPEDVEMHNQFAYDKADAEALRKKVADALKFVADRARAEKILKTGQYDVILCGEQLPTVLTYFAEKSHVSMVYPHYSEWQVGDAVQKAKKGEKISVTLRATVPYSDEGIPMKDKALVKNGVLKSFHGGNRFSQYVGVAPTGDYEKFSCDNIGTLSFADMKKQGPCLVTVVYSDFQMDAFTGHFGGEIRLAYLVDGDSVIPVTGGSVNGSFLEAQGNLTFSTDRYSTLQYDGPYAMKVPGVPVAGIDG